MDSVLGRVVRVRVTCLLGVVLLAACQTSVSGTGDGTGGSVSTDSGGSGGDSDDDASGGLGGDDGAGGTSNSSGGSGTGGTEPTWCDEQDLPEGVLEDDFACADFDRGLPSDFTLDDEGGHLTITEAVAFSAPASLDLQAPGLTNATNVSTLSWTTTGALAVSTASVSAKINPTAAGGIVTPYDTFIEILCLDGGDGRACINYTEGGDVDFSYYTGFFLKWTMSSGPPVLAEFPISDVTDNLWTDISLSIAPGGSVVATVGSETVTEESLGVPATTSITAVVGGDSNYGDTGPFNVRIDDVLVSVER